MTIELSLKENNVGLPPSLPERPIANLEDIPVGARLQDPEISASVSIDISAGLVACSQIMVNASTKILRKCLHNSTQKKRH
ncbi:hypothetical protein ABIE66_000795 [Peribacillus sp. B2I2]